MTTILRARRGRPPIDPDERRAPKLSVRVARVELDEMRRAARAAGIPISRWARHVLTVEAVVSTARKEKAPDS